MLRDMGGPLPHGVAALNLSGEEEWVQAGEQRRQHRRDLQELAALRAERDATPRLDAMVSRLKSTNNRMQQLVDNPPMQYKSEFHGYDLNEAFRHDRVERGLAAQTYLKRG
ncbi:hypothetical protein [Rhodococcus sp. p52]|uniref:hypothetical protein n=1 Tax=Rhodococcus sp. p52 TaxID=935199 RepID=UPI000AA2DC9A|nr:hypothetical protein [Rhodococcus sp. p52]